MRYFVITNDGQRYGPAEMRLLQQWADENRLLPNMLLQEEMTGDRVVATSVPGLVFRTNQTQAFYNPQSPFGASHGPQGQSPFHQAPHDPYAAPYYRQNMQYIAPSSGGDTEYTLSWVLGALGLVVGGFCWMFGAPMAALGLVFGLVAKKKGHPAATPPIVFSIVVLALDVLLFLVAIAVGF